MKNFAIKAKKTIKKVAAMSVGAAMIGSTLFGAVAADLGTYPGPFVENGMWNTVIVVGADALPADVAGAIDISATLSQQATTAYATTSTTRTVEGGVSLASGDDKVFYEYELGDAGLTAVTEDDMPALLVDGTFVDDDGEEYDYSQKIEIGTTGPEFDFTTSGNDLDDPALVIQIGTSPSVNYAYQYVVDFDEAINFSAAASIGEELTIFGKTYSVGSSTDNDEIQLLGGALDVSLNWGETKTVTFQGENYDITLVGVQDDTSGDKATLTINGDTETVRQGATKRIGGVDVYADTVNYYGLDAYPGDAIISIGADELWLKSGDEVQVGSNKDDIDGTEVNWTATTDDTTEDVTQITIRIAAQDNDFDHIGIGEDFMDPVFETIKLTLTDVVNGPDITTGSGVDANSDRKVLEITASDKNTLQLELTDSNGGTETFEWIHDTAETTDGDPVLSDSDDNTFAIYEGAALDEENGGNGDTYTILNSNGEYSGFVRIDNLDDADKTSVDLDVVDVITGTTIISWDDKDISGGEDFTFKGKTYTATVATDDGGVTIVDSTTAKTNVYPYIELYSGYDHRVAFVDEVNEELIAAGGTANDSEELEGTYIFPTGEVAIYFNDSDEVIDRIWADVGGTETTLTTNADTNVTIGSAIYTFDCGAYANLTQCNISFNDHTQPGILIVEEDDATNSDVKESIYLLADDDAGTDDDDVTIETPVMSGTNSGALALDDSDLSAYIDTFGTYVIRSTAGDQDADTTITIPEQQMYASVFVSPTDAVTSTTSSTAGVTIHSVSGVDVAKLDTEVTDKTSKPMILVGGPCVNDLVAELAADGKFRYGCSDWPGSNFGIIETADNAFGGTKMAIVVAGTRAEDTRRACKVLKDFEDYTLSGTSMKVTGTQTTPVVEPYVEETPEEPATPAEPTE